MAKKNFQKEDEQLENMNEALTTTGQWIEDHSNMLTWIIAAIAAVVLGVIALNNYVIRPKGMEASNEMAKAETYFLRGEFQKALMGDEAECIGFEEIANSYRLFQQGKLAALYAGICHYEMGEFDEAAEYLHRFSAKEDLVDPAAAMLLGDAFVHMEELHKAVSAFEKAGKSGNELIAPIAWKKAGLTYLELGNKKAAKNAFVTIRDAYPASAEARDIDRYVAMAE